jgi:hypothetical protein
MCNTRCPGAAAVTQVDGTAPCCCCCTCGQVLAPDGPAAVEQQLRCAACEARHAAGMRCGGICGSVWLPCESDGMAVCHRCGVHVHAACDAAAATVVAAATEVEAAAEAQKVRFCLCTATHVCHTCGPCFAVDVE